MLNGGGTIARARDVQSGRDRIKYIDRPTSYLKWEDIEALRKKLTDNGYYKP